MNVKLMKMVDGTLGVLLGACLPGRGPAASLAPKRVLFIRPGGIGDAVLLIPSILAVKESCPEAEISVLAERRNAAAFSLCQAVNRLFLYDDPGQLMKAVADGYDLIIDSEQWHRLSAVVARLACAPVSIGFATNGRKRLFSHRVDYAHDDYEAFSFYRLLQPLGITAPADLPVPFLTVPEEAAQRMAGLSPSDCFVTIFPGASISERRWGAERFRRVADHLALRGVSVVVVGGEDDAQEGEHIVRMCRGLNLAGKTTLAETAAVMARSALLISGDSGLLHIAEGLGVSTVSLFGPGIAAKWGPRGEGHRVLNLQLPCSPCTRFGTTPPCPDKARCMSEIAVNDVVAAACELLERYRSPDL